MAGNKLNEARQRFVEFYCTIAQGNGAYAYRLAYPLAKSGHNANAARLIAKDSVKKAIIAKKQQIAKDNKDKIELMTDNWLSLAERSKMANDRATEARCYENLSKHYGFYLEDNRQRAEQVQLDERQRVEAQRIAALLLREGLSQPHTKAIASEVVADSPIAATAGSSGGNSARQRQNPQGGGGDLHSSKPLNADAFCEYEEFRTK